MTDAAATQSAGTLDSRHVGSLVQIPNLHGVHAGGWSKPYLIDAITHTRDGVYLDGPHFPAGRIDHDTPVIVSDPPQ